MGACRDPCPKRRVSRSTLGYARPRLASVRPPAPRHGRHGLFMGLAWFPPWSAALARIGAPATGLLGPDADTDPGPPRAAVAWLPPPSGRARCRRPHNRNGATHPPPCARRTRDA